jgi:AraC-like DNA-binding protein
MASEQVVEPLHRFPIFKTSDIEEFGHAILTGFGGAKAEVKKRSDFEARGNLVQLQDIALLHGASNSSVSIDYPETSLFRLVTAIDGGGEASIAGKATTIDQRRSCIISSGYQTKITGEGQHGWLTLRVSGSAIEQRLIAILGYRPKGRLVFDSSVDHDRPEMRLLRQLIAFLTEQLDTTAATLPAAVLGSLEQALIGALLFANRHSFSNLLERKVPDTSSREVRRVEEYIEANWNKPVRIADLAGLTNVSSRSLFKSFRTARGYSPMAFAKMIRLKHARQLLGFADSKTSVADAAFNCGFGNLGHFAKDYREAFGELPSETLARARGS